MSDHTLITVDAEDELDALLETSVRDHWGDGLPIIPPTPERVQRALAAVDLDPGRVLGVLPPSGAPATVRDVTVNAVMAGCATRHLPLVFAAVEAMCDPRFNIISTQVTTHPVGVASFVSGPAGARLGVNSGSNAFGPGNRANATVGRAIRLVMLNVGRGVPVVVDQATVGIPSKYTWFFGENVDASPWPSWARRSGSEPDGSTVTVFGAGGFLNLLETSTSAEEIIDTFAASIAAPNGNDFLLCGQPLLVVCPEHAEVLAGGGYDIPRLQQRLWESARVPVRSFSGSAQRYRLAPTWTELLGELGPDTLIPLCARPDDVLVVVAGGHGRHSVYISGTGVSPSCDARLDPYLDALKEGTWR